MTRRDWLQSVSGALLAGCGIADAGRRSDRIKAFCIDFNWAPNHRFAPPGMFASASPREHFNWYRRMSVNTIQTFCVSCIGYAWYRSSAVAPVMPGLSEDFLKDISNLAHQAGVRSMGYFCVAANTYWGQTHPDLSHGTRSTPHIPLTVTYLDYLDRSIRDALEKIEIDGFMIDWLWNVKPVWLPCERDMYAELMRKPFPGESRVGQEDTDEFGRRAVRRAWEHIHSAAKDVRKNCILWLSCNDLHNSQVAGSPILRELDWVMNENPDPSYLVRIENLVGSHTQLIQNICGWVAATRLTR